MTIRCHSEYDLIIGPQFFFYTINNSLQTAEKCVSKNLDSLVFEYKIDWNRQILQWEDH